MVVQFPLELTLSPGLPCLKLPSVSSKYLSRFLSRDMTLIRCGKKATDRCTSRLHPSHIQHLRGLRCHLSSLSPNTEIFSPDFPALDSSGLLPVTGNSLPIKGVSSRLPRLAQSDCLFSPWETGLLISCWILPSVQVSIAMWTSSLFEQNILQP